MIVFCICLWKWARVQKNELANSNNNKSTKFLNLLNLLNHSFYQLKNRFAHIPLCIIASCFNSVIRIAIFVFNSNKNGFANLPIYQSIPIKWKIRRKTKCEYWNSTIKLKDEITRKRMEKVQWALYILTHSYRIMYSGFSMQSPDLKFFVLILKTSANFG